MLKIHHCTALGPLGGSAAAPVARTASSPVASATDALGAGAVELGGPAGQPIESALGGALVAKGPYTPREVVIEWTTWADVNVPTAVSDGQTWARVAVAVKDDQWKDSSLKAAAEQIKERRGTRYV